VTVDVVERPTGSFSFGAGVGSADGFLLNGSIRQDNLFGRGWAVNASADIGSDSQFASLRFNNPAFMNTAMGLGTALTFSDFEFDDFSQEVTGLHLDVSYPLDEGETTGTFGYGYSSRDVTGFSEFQASSLLQREEYQGETTTSMLTLAARYDTRDDIRFPRNGQVSGVALEYAGLGGLSQFVRLEGRTSWFLPAKRWTGFESTFVVNSRIGYVIPLNTISDFDLPGCESAGCIADLAPNNQPLTNIDTDLELPLTERYFLGGVGPFQVRGFEQRSLGPRRSVLVPTSNPTLEDVLFTPSGRDPTNTAICNSSAGCNDLTDTDIDDFENLDLTDVIGGDKMFLLNFELQFPISEDLGLMGIVFFDMGNAFGENESISPADLRLGTGVGAQWFSPFGPILVQLGFPLDPLEDEDGSVFEFSLGGQRF
jgi:outer membrane protein insertion porin family